MNSDGEHVHIHIDAGALEPGTHYHVHIGSTVIGHEIPGEADVAAAGADRAAEMAAVINGYGDAAVLRVIYDELTGAGFVGIPPKPRKPGARPQRYLSWIDPARERSSQAAIRYDAHNIWFIREDDLALISGLHLHGAKLNPEGKQHNVHFRISQDNLESILAAIRRIKR